MIYGGAADATNAGAIMKEGRVDGLLVGRQSLEPATFKTLLIEVQSAIEFLRDFKARRIQGRNSSSDLIERSVENGVVQDDFRIVASLETFEIYKKKMAASLLSLPIVKQTKEKAARSMLRQ